MGVTCYSPHVLLQTLHMLSLAERKQQECVQACKALEVNQLGGNQHPASRQGSIMTMVWGATRHAQAPKL